MNLRDLKAYLNSLPAELDHCEVILQADAEGNGYRVLSGGETGIYEALSSWHGNVYHPDSTARECMLMDEEWDALKGDPTKQCIVLYPIN